MLWLLVCDPAWASGARVALVGTPGNVERATSTALHTWKIDVIELPADEWLDRDHLMQRAKAVALQHDAAAVVWLSGSHGECTLWLYDVQRDHVLTRPLASGPPFSDPAAAAVALSIKTLLRHSTIAPASERIAVPAASASRLRVAGRLGARLGSGGDKGAELRVGAGLAWTPRALARAYSIAVELGVGSGVDVSRSRFVGALSDDVLAAMGMRRFALGGGVEAIAGLGASVHLTRLDGTLEGSMARKSTWRLNPAGDASAALRIALGAHVDGEIRVGAAYLLRRQRYVAYGQHVVDAPRMVVEAGIGVGARLPW